MTMEKTDAVLAGILDQLQAVVIEQGPEAVALAGQIYQLEAAGLLIRTFAALVLGAGFAWLFFRLKAKEDAQDDAWDAANLRNIGAIASGVFAVASVTLGFIGFLGTFISPLNWAKALDPQIALAANILDKL